MSKKKIKVYSRLFFHSFRFRTEVSGGKFFVDVAKPSGWTHYVLNFLGSSSGMEVYADGTPVGSSDTLLGAGNDVGERRIVIGRDYNRYASVTVDELLFFNQHLNSTQITSLSQVTEYKIKSTQ